jgi:hypothetical protein
MSITVKMVERKEILQRVTANAGLRIGRTERMEINEDSVLRYELVRYWFDNTGRLHHVDSVS